MSDVNNLELIQAKLPHWYKKYEKDKSVLYAIISSLADQLNISSDFVSRLDEMLGIETTRDEDLEYRWGSLLNMPKSVNESYDDYRYKLMMTYSALTNGGTVESLKFAIAAILGVSRRSEDIDQYIKVYDAWEYDGVIPGYDPTVAKYGSFVCTIDFRILEGISSYYSKLYDALNRTKASGTVPYFMILYISEDTINVRFDEKVLEKIKDTYSESGYMPSTRKAQIPMLNGYGVLNTMFVLNSYKDYGYDPDVVVDKIQYIMNEVGKIDAKKVKMFDRMSPMITNQSPTNEYMDTDTSVMTIGIVPQHDISKIRSNADEHPDIARVIEVKDELGRVSNDENLLDELSDTIQEKQNLQRVGTGMWSGLSGTNSPAVVLNNGLITNMLMDTDECLDVIKINI